jgi:hypothetical protein
MVRRLRLSFILLLAAGCQYVTGLEDLEIVASSQGAGPQGGESSGAGSTGGAPNGAGGAGGVHLGGNGGEGGEGGTPAVTTEIHDFAAGQPLSIAQNDSAVFFSDNELGAGMGRIWRWSKSDPDAPAQPIATELDDPRNVSATATELYWTTGTPASQVVSAPLSDPMASGVVANGSAIQDVEVDPAGVAFYADSVGVHVIGGATIYSGAGSRLDAKDTAALFMLGSLGILRLNKDGSGSPETVLSGGGKGGYVALATDAGVVFAANSTGIVARADKDGDNPDFDLAALGVVVNDVAVDERDDQIHIATVGGIVRLPKTGGAPTTVASGGTVWRVLLDDDFAYWFDLSSGGVFRTTR